MQIDDKLLIDAIQQIGMVKQLADSHEISIKELFGRMGNQEKISVRSEEVVKNIKCSIDEVKVSINEMKVSLNRTLESAQKNIRDLEREPVENWKHAKKTAIGAIVSLVIAAVIGVFSAVTVSKNNQEIATVKHQYELQLDKYQDELKEIKLQLKERSECN